MWIFGYGSLIWYTNFPYVNSIPGYVKGYARRFWQASPDHRGTSDVPGRTVTLVVSETEVVWGRAYEVAKENEEAVKAYLDFREKAGYSLRRVTFYPRPDLNMEPFDVEVYISVPDRTNIYYVGPETIADIAQRVVTSVGPSGTNIEYVLRLAHGVRQLHPTGLDDHLAELENEVLRLCQLKGIADAVLKELGYDLLEFTARTNSKSTVIHIAKHIQ